MYKLWCWANNPGSGFSVECIVRALHLLLLCHLCGSKQLLVPLKWAFWVVRNLCLYVR